VSWDGSGGSSCRTSAAMVPYGYGYGSCGLGCHGMVLVVHPDGSAALVPYGCGSCRHWLSWDGSGGSS
jgi:hypothetical protein